MDDTDALDPDGDPNAANPSDRAPRISQQAKNFLAEAESLSDELFWIAELFGCQVTSNEPRFADGDAGRPIYHIGDFIETIKDAFIRRGWSAPE